METLSDIFAHVCGQNHCFAAGGVDLPVCQRCLGLYVAAALTAAWLAATGIRRRGLPSWGVFLVHEAALLAALLAGVHVWAWGASPVGKLTCGLWTGHVAILWLIGGAGHLWRLSRPAPRAQLPWRTGDKVQAAAAPLVLAGLAQLIPHAMSLGWGFWSAVVVAGALALAAAVAAAAAAIIAYVLALLRRRGCAPVRA
jgi:hypothetical protein